MSQATQWLKFISQVGIGKTFIGTPPVGWQNLAFDDSKWIVPVQAGNLTGTGSVFLINPEGGAPSPTLASILVTGHPVSWPGPLPQPSAFRFPFNLPRVPLSSVTYTIYSFQVSICDFPGPPSVWVNGTLATVTPEVTPHWYSITIPTSALLPGKNIIALSSTQTSPFYIDTASYLISMSALYPSHPDGLAAWLVVDEPTVGLTDQTSYLFKGDGAQHTFNNQVRKRGNANYTMVARYGDSYEPTFNSPMFLYDQTPAGFTCVFSGVIQSFVNRQIGNQGNRFIDVTAVSLEALIDTVYAEPQQFVNQTCGFMVNSLFGQYLLDSPISLGVVSDGVTIPLFNVPDGAYISDLFTQLATTCGFIWGVDPQTQTFYFCLPSNTIAPYQITGNLPLFETITWGYDGSDYRNRQGISLSYDAFPHSVEFFQNDGTGTQKMFTLLRPVEQIVNAWVTLSTPGAAEGLFSGQPMPGDTVTTGPASGAWQGPAHAYAYGGIIVINGYVQKVTTPSAGSGTLNSGSSQPTFTTVTGGTTTDGSVIWTCLGPIGLGTGLQTYTFCQQDLSSSSPYNGQWLPSSAYASSAEVFIVGGMVQQSSGGTSGTVQPTWNNTIGGSTVDGTITWTCLGPWLDNTQFGLVLIDPISVINTNQNLVDALNSNITVRGITFSLPTWENSQGVAIVSSSVGFTFQQKGPGTSNISSLAFTGSSFGWFNFASPHVAIAATIGGTSPQGSLGPNEGATISLQVYAVGTNTSAPAISYTQGSNIVQLATPLSKGNLCVEYTRPDGNVIEVENTPLIPALSAQTYGTGKNQRFSNQSTEGLINVSSSAGLQFAQQALAAFDVLPKKLSLELLIPGLSPGQELVFALTGYYAILNGTYFINEIRGELIPGATYPWMNQQVVPGGGHYRYTIDLINVAQIGDYLDFWSPGGGGGGGASSGGGSGGSSLAATSGGTVSSNGNALTDGGVNYHGPNSYVANAADNGVLHSFNDPTTSRTLTLPSVPPYAQWHIWVENIGFQNLNVDPNGCLLDKAAGGLLIPQNQGVGIYTDGVNYYTTRGLLPVSNVGAMFQIASVTVAALTNKVSFLSIPNTYNHLQIMMMALTSDGVWAATTVYALNTVLVQFFTASSTYYYWKVTTAGTSGSSIPAFSTHSSGTLSDGSVVWTNTGADSAANIDASIVFNGDLSGGNYARAFYLQAASGSGGSTNTGITPPTTGPAAGIWMPTPRNAKYNIPAMCVADIPFYKNTSFGKVMLTKGGNVQGAPGAGQLFTVMTSIEYNPTAAISQIDFYVEDGTYFAIGTSFILYGIF